MAGATPPPLGVYIHWPWCLKRCAYCDFNARAGGRQAPVDDFVVAAEAELRRLAAWLGAERARYGAIAPLLDGAQSVFFGGGTPSLLPAAAIEQILAAVDYHIGIADDAEVTLEANPGAQEHGAWGDYRAAGVNRLSLGVQSLDDSLLVRLGRIHDSRAALEAIAQAWAAGFSRLNADLMYGLPGQSVAAAQADIQRLLEVGVGHISHYQLTLETETPMGRQPPADLPDELTITEMEEVCRQAMFDYGLRRYEISAFACDEQRCRHNLNYWTYGDYLGVGPGAHGKLTLAPGRVVRNIAGGHPRQWLSAAGSDRAEAEHWSLSREEISFEVFANGLRLPAGVELRRAELHSGLAVSELIRRVAHLLDSGWLEWRDGRLYASSSGLEMLDSVLESLLPAY